MSEDLKHIVEIIHAVLNKGGKIKLIEIKYEKIPSDQPGLQVYYETRPSLKIEYEQS